MRSRLEFIAGSPALDLADTVSGRGKDEIDLLSTEAALAAWLVEAGLLPAKLTAITADDLRAARQLREAIFQCAFAALNGLPLPMAEVGVINHFAALPSFRPQLLNDFVVLEASEPTQAALSSLAAHAIGILSRPDRERLRACPGCNMLFLDRSRPGQRRWCSSASGCGNRAKVQDFRRRQISNKGGCV